jgi:hypothetical protein
MMRRGATLLEILAAMPIFMAVVVLFSALFPDVILTPSRLERSSQTAVGLSHFAGCVRSDVEAALSVPAEFAGRSSGDDTLILEFADGMICYTPGDGEDELVRLALPTTPGGEEQVTNSWSLPGAAVSFELLREQDEPYAAVLRTGVIQEATGRREKLNAAEVLFPLGLQRRDPK